MSRRNLLIGVAVAVILVILVREFVNFRESATPAMKQKSPEPDRHINDEIAEPVATKPKFLVAGYTGCGYFAGAKQALHNAQSAHDSVFDIEVVEYARPEYMKWLAEQTKEHGVAHRTSPIVFLDGKYIGGRDATVAYLTKHFPTAL
eukprot:TRINITY_DN13692_c0_g1_i1.p1 TRINITY_DN13692_c0_g1~~TRINITY_DN13692_c0_g1_i1.p1  ORF type:complete len:147 (+),score=25.33 TRINITY_DN13692_c0_g1_i1:68-508(+)